MRVKMNESRVAKTHRGGTLLVREFYTERTGELLIWRALALTYGKRRAYTPFRGAATSACHGCIHEKRTPGRRDAPRANESVRLCVSELIALHGIKAPVSLSLCGTSYSRDLHRGLGLFSLHETMH